MIRPIENINVLMNFQQQKQKKKEFKPLKIKKQKFQKVNIISKYSIDIRI